MEGEGYVPPRWGQPQNVGSESPSPYLGYSRPFRLNVILTVKGKGPRAQSCVRWSGFPNLCQWPSPVLVTPLGSGLTVPF